MNPESDKIEKCLKAVGSRIRRVQKIRAAMVVATMGLAGLLIIVAADYFLAPLPGAVRWGLSVGWLAAVIATMRMSFQPLLKPLGIRQVARWLETRHPEMEERLSTVLEMAHGNAAESSELLVWLTKAAEADVNQLDIIREVNAARTSWRWGRPALALSVVILLGFLVWPREARRLFVRALTPFSNRGNAGAGHFMIQPGDIEVFDDDAVDFKVTYDGQERNPALRMQFDDGRNFSQKFSETGGKLTYLLDPVKESFRYQARAGRDESDVFTLTVWPLPELRATQVTLNFPAYTNVPLLKSGLATTVEGISGTKVVLTGLTNTVVESAWVEMNGKHLAEGKFENATKSGAISFEWKLGSDGTGDAVLILKHRLGRMVNACRFGVKLLGDQVPKVVLTFPIEPVLPVRPDEFFDLTYEVTEDFSLVKVAVEVQAVGRDSLMLDQLMPQQVGDSKPPIFCGATQISLGEMRSRFPGVNEMRMRVKAEDGRPPNFGGPGVGFSEWVNLRIDGAAESLARQALQKEQEGVKQTVEKAILAMRKVREQIDRHREEIKTGELSETAQKDFDEAHENLATTREELEQLSDQMAQGIYASQANEVTSAAEEVAKARENLENSRLQDTPPERTSMLDQVCSESEAAAKLLESVRDAIDRKREKIEDLAQLQDLAQKQKEVARQAKEKLADAPNDPPSQDWQRNQKQLEEALRQQLDGRPDAKAEALRSQAQQATTLAQQAEKMAKSQQNLEAQTKQVSEPMPSVAKGDRTAALKDLQMTQANAAQELAQSMTNMPQITHSDSMKVAEDYAKKASEQAKSAAEQWQNGQVQEASKQHDQSSQSFDKSAAALNRAAKEFSQMAEQAAGQTIQPERAEANADDLADAFQKASEAADSPQAAQAAAKAASAAQAMGQAAQSARQKMHGHKPKPSSKQLPPGGIPRQKPSEDSQTPGAGPRLPPEMVKLGISLADWEKIQTSLKSDVGATEGNAISPEYRELVRSYFESISKKSTND
jgi:hypothetical protein